MIIRRVLYTIPLVLGVCVITFLLFDVIFSPEARATRELGRHASQERIDDLLRSRGWDKPLLVNRSAPGLAKFTDTRFGRRMASLLLFRFGRSEKTHEDIGWKILRGMGPSLTLTVPIFVIGLTLGLVLSLLVAYFRATYLDLAGVVVCVALMAVSILVYIIAGQYLLALNMRLFPVFGYAGGASSVKFLLLPILIAVLRGLGGDIRFYRTIFLEEVSRDYVRTARAKGLSEPMIMLKHVLKNVLIPILTQTVIAIPFLFLGSLLLENFFGIPGLGNMTIEAVNNGDTAVMGAMVYLGALLFVFGNLLTDITYAFADPRIRLR